MRGFKRYKKRVFFFGLNIAFTLFPNLENELEQSSIHHSWLRVYSAWITAHNIETQDSDSEKQHWRQNNKQQTLQNHDEIFQTLQQLRYTKQ